MQKWVTKTWGKKTLKKLLKEARWRSRKIYALRLEGPGFDSCLGKLWALAACPKNCVIGAHTHKRRGLAKGSFCVEFACSPRVHKKHAVILVSILPPPGQPGRLMEGKGTGWNNVFLPHITSNQASLSGDKKRFTPHVLSSV